MQTVSVELGTERRAFLLRQSFDLCWFVDSLVEQRQIGVVTIDAIAPLASDLPQYARFFEPQKDGIGCRLRNTDTPFNPRGIDQRLAKESIEDCQIVQRAPVHLQLSPAATKGPPLRHE